MEDQRNPKNLGDEKHMINLLNVSSEYANFGVVGMQSRSSPHLFFHTDPSNRSKNKMSQLQDLKARVSDSIRLTWENYYVFDEDLETSELYAEENAAALEMAQDLSLWKMAWMNIMMKFEEIRMKRRRSKRIGKKVQKCMARFTLNQFSENIWQHVAAERPGIMDIKFPSCNDGVCEFYNRSGSVCVGCGQCVRYERSTALQNEISQIMANNRSNAEEIDDSDELDELFDCTEDSEEELFDCTE